MITLAIKFAAYNLYNLNAHLKSGLCVCVCAVCSISNAICFRKVEHNESADYNLWRLLLTFEWIKFDAAFAWLKALKWLKNQLILETEHFAWP